MLIGCKQRGFHWSAGKSQVWRDYHSEFSRRLADMRSDSGAFAIFNLRLHQRKFTYCEAEQRIPKVGRISSHLSKHDSLSLDSSNAPSRHTESINHGRVRIGPDETVGIQKAVLVKDDAGEVLQIDLQGMTFL
jgi:hypothetical protein